MTRALSLLLACVLAAPARTPTPSPPPLDRAALASRVRAEFQFAWEAYKKTAWGHDELKPVSGAFKDWYAEPLLMTPVDALDTMLMLGLTEEATRTRSFIDER